MNRELDNKDTTCTEGSSREPTPEEVAMLQSKADAFDELVSHLHESGFDVSTSTHTDVAALVSSLAFEGLEASCQKMARSIARSYEQTVNLSHKFQVETTPLLESLKAMVTGYGEMSQSVSDLVQSDKSKTLVDTEIRKQLNDLHEISKTLDIFSRIGTNDDINGTSKISLDKEANGFMKGILKCIEASSTGNLMQVGSRSGFGGGRAP